MQGLNLTMACRAVLDYEGQQGRIAGYEGFEHDMAQMAEVRT